MTTPVLSPVVVGPVTSSADRRHVEFTVRIEGSDEKVYFHSDDIELIPNLEAIVTPLLLPAMTLHEPLTGEGSLDPVFAANLDTVQDIFAIWVQYLERVPIEFAPGVAGRVAPGARVAQFFSGGVDSFYTLLKHRDEIDDLILIHGFDIPLDKTELRAATSAAVRRVGEALGKRVIEIETNLEGLIGRYSGWVEFNLGPALAAIGHLLAPDWGRIYIPASYDYRRLMPCGSHPLLDPLWSTSRLSFVHDGCEATRAMKVRAIGEQDIALQNLRVCYYNTHDLFNCGMCNKCVSTMLSLRAAGALDRCPTFATPLTVRKIALLDGSDPDFAPRLTEILEILEQADRDADAPIRRALRKSLTNKSLFRRVKERISDMLWEKPERFYRVQRVYQKVAGLFWPKLPPSSGAGRG